MSRRHTTTATMIFVIINIKQDRVLLLSDVIISVVRTIMMCSHSTCTSWIDMYSRYIHTYNPTKLFLHDVDFGQLEIGHAR